MDVVVGFSGMHPAFGGRFHEMARAVTQTDGLGWGCVAPLALFTRRIFSPERAALAESRRNEAWFESIPNNGCTRAFYLYCRLTPVCAICTGNPSACSIACAMLWLSSCVHVLRRWKSSTRGSPSMPPRFAASLSASS